MTKYNTSQRITESLLNFDVSKILWNAINNGRFPYLLKPDLLRQRKKNMHIATKPSVVAQRALVITMIS